MPPAGQADENLSRTHRAYPRVLASRAACDLDRTAHARATLVKPERVRYSLPMIQRSFWPVRAPHVVVFAAMAMIAVAPSVALAQLGTGGDSLTTAARNRAAAPLPQKTPAPPALPGAQSSTAVAPPQRVPLDMPPTEALFDGVNRGDIEAVRDSLARGAELNARNILGITATELAIDLGRNDIAFLLLSMRGADRPRSARGSAGGSTQAVGTQAGAQRVQGQVRPTPQPRATPARAEAPRTYPNDPGTPAPAAGFLGFDERAASRYR